MPAASLIEHFRDLEDPRQPHLVAHPLLDILALTICAVICGADTWVEVEQYGRAKQPWLQQFLALPNGIPSHDTLTRVFARLDPAQLQTCFLHWVQAVARVSDGSVVAIDGKTLRGSGDDECGPIHMVSAWASRNRLVLGQRKVADKSNEIAAIPELLRVLDLNGCIVTLDAMGCQTAIAEQLQAQGGDYILSLKGNQGSLHEDVAQLFEWGQRQQFRNMPHEFYQTSNSGHGREEVRRHWLLEGVEHLEGAQRWAGLKRVGVVESERRQSGKATSVERRYYLLSLEGDVERFATAVRDHWGIENGLHWVLDVGFREDDSRVRQGNAPENLAVVRHIAQNLLSQEKSAKGGVHAKRMKAGWDNDYLRRVLTQ